MLKSIIFSSLFHIIIILLIFLGIDNKINNEKKFKEIKVNIIEEKIKKVKKTNKKSIVNRTVVKKKKISKSIPKIKEPTSIPKIKEPTSIPKIKEPTSIPKIKEPTAIPEITKKPEIKKKIPQIVKKNTPKTIKDKKSKSLTKNPLKSKKKIIPKIKNIKEYNAIDDISISGRDRSNLKFQITRCFKQQIINKKKLNIDVNVNVTINMAGIIDYNNTVFTNIIELSKLEKYQLKEIKKEILQTFQKCSPLRNLPREKYDIWRRMNIKFKY